MLAWNPEFGQSLADRKPRRAFLFKVDCTNEDGQTVLVRVRNLSATGLGAVVETGLNFVNGEAVVVHFHGVRKVPGRVIWVQSKQFGVTFDRPIVPEEVLAALPRPGTTFKVDDMHKVDKNGYRRPGLLESDI